MALVLNVSSSIPRARRGLRHLACTYDHAGITEDPLANMLAGDVYDLISLSSQDSNVACAHPPPTPLDLRGSDHRLLPVG